MRPGHSASRLKWAVPGSNSRTQSDLFRPDRRQLVAAFVGIGTGGWALTRSTAETTELGCAFDRSMSSVAVIDASSGDLCR